MQKDTDCSGIVGRGKTREAIYSYNKVEKVLFDVHNVVENRSDDLK